MTTAEETRQAGPLSEAVYPLDDLIPIAVVIAAGCESCAEKMVSRALRQGSAPAQVERTLGIVAKLRSLDCLTEAVGPEVVARMAKPLEAGRRALRAADDSTPTCCG
jgi:hypothetical protein